jgi:O-antigen/teichoic acid export membrane protein
VVKARLLRAARTGGARDAGGTYLATGLTLVVNLATGVIIARAVGPDGRGELAAILTLTQVLALVFAAGCNQAIAYHLTRNPTEGGRLLSTWTVMLVPLAILAVGTAELLVPVIFAAQSDEAKALAEIYVLTIGVALLLLPYQGLLIGDRRFGVWNLLRFAQPSLVLTFYLVLLLADAMSVARALEANFLATVLVGLAAAVSSLRLHHWRRPDAALGLRSLWYGLRGVLSTIGATINTRIDLLIMPAFLAASSIGSYAVATNVSGLLVSLSAPLWWLVLPNAARRREGGAGPVLASLHLTLAIGGVLGLLLYLAAGFVVPAVYGDPFSDAVEPLRILLPGCVLLPAASMLTAGLYARNRPFTAAVPHLVGSVITVAGLTLFLATGGIRAAAIITSIAYGVVFLTALVLYRHAAELSWGAFVPSRATTLGWLGS